MNKIARALSLLFLLALVGSLAASETRKSVSGRDGDDWKAFIATAQKGRDYDFPKQISSLLGVKGSWTAKKTVMVANKSSDGRSHQVYILIKSQKKKKSIPASFIFISKKQRKSGGESHYYSVSLDGRLDHAVRLRGRDDKKGKPIRGSGKVKHLGVKKWSTKRRFKHEVDFWLNGKYRKKAKPAKKTK